MEPLDLALVGGALVAEVNLKFTWDVVARIQVGKAGYAYVVDSSGELIAHPDISLVLSRPDLSSLPQIQAILGNPSTVTDEPSVARDLQGHSVLTARAAVDRDGSIDDPHDDDEEWVIESALPLGAIGPSPVTLHASRCDVTKDGVKRCGSWQAAVDLDKLAR